ncbi:MAG: T9SS type A sorting domain-containing protein, partial [Bacteroidota bacterium]
MGFTTTEDSLVLLHRMDESAEWAVVNNVTFQPGGNLKDKVGLFRLQKLLPGDYAFGIRDASMVGVKEENTSPTLSIFPNPVDDELVITLPFPTQAAEVSVYDATGKAVFTRNIKPSNNSFSIKTAFLTNGAYSILVKTGDKTLTGKFIKN